MQITIQCPAGTITVKSGDTGWTVTLPSSTGDKPALDAYEAASHALSEPRCTCPPGERPEVCQQKFALSQCKAVSKQPGLERYITANACSWTLPNGDVRWWCQGEPIPNDMPESLKQRYRSHPKLHWVRYDSDDTADAFSYSAHAWSQQQKPGIRAAVFSDIYPSITASMKDPYNSVALGIQYFKTRIELETLHRVARAAKSFAATASHTAYRELQLALEAAEKAQKTPC
jgi:hypothetical protein